MKLLKTAFLAILIFFSGCQRGTDEPSGFSIDYEKFTLSNGLEVVLHEDHSDPIVAVATIMHVGSSREKPGRTGFAHFFEHMSFNDSENVPRGANRQLIPEWGGSRNGGTSNDMTMYYEVVPKDAFKKILWIDSDRLGYMINTVTEAALEREKQVVKNEKRQMVDNAPYGFTNEVIRKNLYPEGHPYNWTVIGSLPDLQAATLEDVKEFYDRFYGAGNATLCIAGDIDLEETKELVQRWFGEIRQGPEVEPTLPMPVTLEETKSLYYPDQFAKLPEIRMVFPTVEQYHRDEYALSILGELLSGSKKAPLYRLIVEEKKLAPRVNTFQNSSELAGEFMIMARANAGVDLDSVKAAIEEGLSIFEEEGFSDKELTRIKAELESNLYQGIEIVLTKALNLGLDNEFTGDPAHIVKAAEQYNAVTREDIMRVFDLYIRGRHYVMTSFVPQDQQELMVDGARKAEVYLEEITATADFEEVSQGEEAEYEKTPTAQDRSEPEFGPMPLFDMPEVWTDNLDNEGIDFYGIETDEIPLVTFSLTIDGGHWLDPLEKSGVSDLMADLMMQGTALRTPAELEEAIGLLGATINISGGMEAINLTATCLARNFEATVDLVEEILLEPRWDEAEFQRLKLALETGLRDNEANPTSVALGSLLKLLYGEDHILGTLPSGTLETVRNISLEDLKSYYTQNLSPSLASVQVVGFVERERVMNAFNDLADRWEPKTVTMPEYEIPETANTGKLFFVDVPGSSQSTVFAGRLTLSGQDPDYNNLEYANEKLGGGSSGELFQILRIEKGFTYGAYSGLMGTSEISPFIINTSVRSNATKATLEIIRDLLSNYSADFSGKDVEVTKNKILKSNTRAYESMNAKLAILQEMSAFDKSLDFMDEEQDELTALNLEDFRSVIDKYIIEDQMLYVVVGDKATQFQEVVDLGKEVIELDIHGDPVGESMAAN